MTFKNILYEPFSQINQKVLIAMMQTTTICFALKCFIFSALCDKLIPLNDGKNPITSVDQKAII